VATRCDSLRTEARWLALLFVLCLILALSGCGGNGGSAPGAVVWIVGASSGGYGSIARSEDSGATWTRQGSAASIPDADLEAIRVVDENRLWAVGLAAGGYANILKSDDGGRHWLRVGSPAQLPNENLYGLASPDGRRVWAVGAHGTILHSRDAGVTWSRQAVGQTSSGVQLASVSAVDTQNLWVVGGSQEGHPVILHTLDSGVTWTPQGAGQVPDDSKLITVQAVDRKTAWAVGEGSIAMYTGNAGTTWTNRSPLQPPDFFDANGIFAIGSSVWIARDQGVIYGSTNGGATWTLQQVPAGAHGFELLRVRAADTKHAWAVGASISVPFHPGIVLHTTDGSEWQSQNPGVDANWFDVDCVRVSGGD
jgi:photosystem II stability/assembly factor-like uncharacterized protein